MKKLVIAISGASGAQYAKRLLDKLVNLQDQIADICVVITENGIANWELEIGPFDSHHYPFTFYKNRDFNAPFASGSAQYTAMIICPCSMGMLARIATGTSNDLISRAADVMLKERRTLIVVPRETPLSLIHLRNMVTLTEAGGIVCPASPSFYHKSTALEQVLDTVVHRVLDLAGLDIEAVRWGSP